MDLQAIYAALSSTLSADQTQRKAAEAALKGWEGQPGYVSSLFRVVNSTEVAVEVRQAGIVYFKNLVNKHWERDKPIDGAEQWVIAEDERVFVRSSILEALVQADSRCRPVIAESLRRIAANDFPDKMPTFLQEVAQRMDVAAPPEQIHGALVALRVLTKNYEYAASEKRDGPLSQILPATFPRMVALMEATLSAPCGDEKSAEMQKVMIKVVWSSLHQSVPRYLQDGQVFMQWMSLLYRVIEAPVPDQAKVLGGRDADDVGKLVFWKCKRWAAQILHRLFQKYGNPKTCEKQFKDKGREGEVVLSRAFHDQLANSFLQMFMQMLATKAQGQFLPERFVVEALNYLQTGVTLARTWQDMKPNVMALITHVLFPMLCFDAKDQELWEDDPHEFVRKTHDIMEDYTSERVASCNLIIDLCKKRTQTTLVPTLEMCVGHMKAYAEGGGSASALDGAMHCVGSLERSLQTGKLAAQYEPQVKWLLVTYVMPALTAPQGHVRARAAWAASQFAETVSKDAEFSQQIVTGVMSQLRDTDFAVRFQAAVSLRHLIYDSEEGQARPSVLPIVEKVLPQLLDELFKLMDEIGNDELVATLEVLIEAFSEQMAPYAQGLCQRLAEHFVRLAISESGQEAEEEASFAAVQCCSAITTLLENIKSSPDLYPMLEPFLVPMLHRILTPDEKGEYLCMEFMEDGLEILTYLTYYAPTLSDAVWSLFRPLAQSFHDWAFDYLHNINLPLDNFISRSNDKFLSSPDNIQIVYKVIDKAMSEENSSDRDCVEGCKLSESLVLNCPGALDAYIPSLLKLVLDRLARAQARSAAGEPGPSGGMRAYCRTELMKMACICLYYNPQGALQSLEQQGGTQTLFHMLFWALADSQAGEPDEAPSKTHFRGLHDQKIAILGLTSLLKVPVSQLPASVGQGFSTVIEALVSLQVELRQNRQKKEEQDAAEGEEADDDEDEGVIDVADDEDEEDDADDDLDAVLRKIAALKDEGGLFGGDSEIEDEEDYISPIDDVDEVLFFVEVFMSWQSANGTDVTAAIGAQLQPATSATLQVICLFISSLFCAHLCATAPVCVGCASVCVCLCYCSELLSRQVVLSRHLRKQDIIASVPQRQAELAQKKAQEAAKTAGCVFFDSPCVCVCVRACAQHDEEGRRKNKPISNTEEHSEIHTYMRAHVCMQRCAGIDGLLI